MARKVEKYDDPNFKLLREQMMPAVQGPLSLIDFAHFRSRNKCIVHAIHVRVASGASVAGGSMVAVRARNTPSNASVQTINSFSLVSQTSAGSMFTITLASLNTVNSISDHIALRLKTTDLGKYDVTYEYQILPNQTLTIIP